MALTYSLVSGTLPAGLSVDPNSGLLSGLIIPENPPQWVTSSGTIANVAELSSVSVQLSATPVDGVSAIQYSLVPVERNPNAALPFGATLSLTGLISGTVGEEYGITSQSFRDDQLPLWVTNAGLLRTVDELSAISNITLVANARSGTNTISTYSVMDGCLPYGLVLSLSGVISGTPNEEPGSDVAEKTPKPIWTTLAGGLGFVNENASANFTLVANAVNSTITSYSIISGLLPFGFVLMPNSGVLSGTSPEITDPNEPAYAIADQPTWVTGQTLGTFANSTSVNTTLTATAVSGRTMSSYSLVPGAEMPFGLVLTPAGVLSGTIKSSAATYSFIIRATDSAGAYANKIFTMTVT